MLESERSCALNDNKSQPVNALVVIVEGFDEVEAVVTLSTLRREGINTKSVGLTDGIIRGAHGILLKPDYTLTDLSQSMDILSINLVVLPGDVRNLAALEVDPRIHSLLGQLLTRGGIVAANIQSQPTLQMMLAQQYLADEHRASQMLFWRPADLSIAAFAQGLARKLVDVG